MAKKCKCPPAGAPEWVMTYGDMMSLLLVFFIMIVSLSEIKQDKYRAVVQSLQDTFGTKAGGGKLPVKDDPKLSLIDRLKTVQKRQRRRNRSQTQDPGIDGPETDVTTVREGMRFVIGGRIAFAPGSAQLSDPVRRQLRQVIQRYDVRGHNNIIELRGHASPMELAGKGGRSSDLWALSFARARAVMRYLTSDQVGLRADRIRLIASADHEPLVKRAYSPADQKPNRRVEIMVTEALVQDYSHPEVQSRH